MERAKPSTMVSIERLFPNANARRKADEAIDKLEPSEKMTTFLDAWEAEYYRIAGHSPFRKPKI